MPARSRFSGSAVPRSISVDRPFLCGGLLVVLIAFARPVMGQRLPAAYPAFAPALVTGTVGAPGRAQYGYEPRICRISRPLRIPFGALAGAAGGWLSYELVLGIWVSAEGAKPDATVRRIRTTAILAGTALGVFTAVVQGRQCRDREPER